MTKNCNEMNDLIGTKKISHLTRQHVKCSHIEKFLVTMGRTR